MVPIVPIENGPFAKEQILSGASVSKCKSNKKNCEDTSRRIATTDSLE